MQNITRAIDALNEKTGLYSSYLVLPLVGAVIYEVFMRYAFNAPTSWGFEMTTFFYGMHYMLGLGDAHRTDTHVCIDIFEARMQPRNRTILRIITNLVMFVPVMGCMAIWSVKYAITSWSMLEHASSSWAPAIYPYKTVMAVGFVLFFLAGVSKLLKDFHALRSAN
ncbi:MAG: TRAP transporter small permease subunit [Desulfoprunum sp.]|nr:TRAP transporter small permease subunit [Desulfoprunum sp.]